MHGSVMAFLRRALRDDEVRGASVLEVGSFDVNGSPRGVILPMKPACYVGTDVRSGPGVDLSVDASRLVETFGPERFDMVVSTEMLEHALDWRKAVHAMKAVLKPHGRLVVTARGPGFPLHDYPVDHWRFTRMDFELIFADMNILALEPDPDFPGVFLLASKPEPFHEVPLDSIAVRRAP